MSVISFVLNFWVKLILGVFIKFVLIKIKNVYINRQKKIVQAYLVFSVVALSSGEQTKC